MKRVRIVLVIALVFIASCAHKKVVEQEVKTIESEEVVVTPIQNESIVEEKPVYITFTPGLLQKTDNSADNPYKNAQEIIKLISQLDITSYLPLVFHIIFHQEIPSIKDKVAIIKALQEASHDTDVNAVLQFFSTVLTENEQYLMGHPLINLHASLVSEPSSTSSEYFKDHPEVSDVVWSIEELYKTGNNLLQEAVRLNNSAAVHYLLSQGASPRHLDDPRGVVLALEWADKYDYKEIAQELASTVNQLNTEHITLLDELLYKDPNAAQLVRKYGGKRAVELT